MAWGLWDRARLGVPVGLRVCWAGHLTNNSPFANLCLMSDEWMPRHYHGGRVMNSTALAVESVTCAE